MKQDSSLVEDASESLITKLWNAIYWELNRYTKIIRGFDPIDWKAFVKWRNKMRSDGQAISEDNIIELDDEKTLEEILEEQNKQRAAEEQTEKPDKYKS